MLLRSSSTPFLHHPFLSSSSPSSRRSSLHLRRAFSDGHLPSLHPSSSFTRNDDAGGSNPRGLLHTELSFSIYNTFGNKCEVVAAPLAPSSSSQGPAQQEQEEGDQQQPTTVVQPEHPEVPLFLRNYAQFLHEVKGDARRAEEYYSRAMLADPSDGEIMSQYAKLVWEVHHDPERCLGYFQKSVQAAPQNSHVLAAYASFLWEQDDDDDCGDQGTERAAGTGQAMELASAAV